MKLKSQVLMDETNEVNLPIPENMAPSISRR